MYIIPLYLCDSFDGVQGALAFSRGASVFASYDEALVAVVTTAAYSQRRHFHWDKGFGWYVFDLFKVVKP